MPLIVDALVSKRTKSLAEAASRQPKKGVGFNADMNFVPLVLMLQPGPAVTQAQLPPILPKPASMTATSSGFEITRGTVLVDPAKTFASKELERMLAKGAGFRMKT